MAKKAGLFVLIVVMVLSMMLTMASCGKDRFEPLDYSKAENWVETDTEGTKPVDVFFIYPTVAMETANKDGFASIDEMADMVVAIRMFQTSAYEESCNVYMPYYRQAAMALADKCNKDNATYLELLYNSKAYADISAALDYYFENYNNGKPFILAAHSQGSALEINVLKHYMQEHKEYLPRMVAAYAIGFAPSEDIFNEKTGLKFATGEDDYNVVVSFTTEGPTAEGKTILLPDKPMVINPLNWKTDDTYADPSLNKGTNVVAPDFSSVTLGPGVDDAQINLERKTVVCTTRSAEDYTISEESFATESFHQKEYSMYFENIRDNVRVRIEAYLKDAA
jgi:Protein of unknown function (DUF3089).